MQIRSRWRRVAPGFCLALLGSVCGDPRVGPGETPPAAEIAITAASVDATSHVVVSYRVTRNGGGVTADSARRMRPSWTLAGLATEPVSGLPAWRSYVLTGGETLDQIPPGGPGTPAALVLHSARQPGFEAGGKVEDLGEGHFRYTFTSVLPPDFDPAQTLRVGVWLDAASGTKTTSTFDFVPSGGPVKSRELVLDANCNGCHGTLQGHGGSRTGTRICVTCHTYQHADGDTVDPAAMAGATIATDPNPLELGRLIHRVHRGSQLPTLYLSNWTQAAPSRPITSPTPVPMPFGPSRNTPLVGQKYSVVDDAGEKVFGRIDARTDNGQPALVVASGVTFPQDLRNCDACHAEAAQRGEIVTAISRRTCQGCHPDVWFGQGAPADVGDQVHFAHPGGPQADDTQCAGCHVATADGSRVDVPIADVHLPIFLSPSYNPLTARIAAVQGLVPGARPTVVFTLSDRDGVPTPLCAPVPASDSLSPVPRALSRVSITLMGRTSSDYHSGNMAVAGAAPVTEQVPVTSPTCSVTTAADANGQFSYTFTNPLPANATGTWTVALEARRQATPNIYDAANDRFLWPYTGERVTEIAENDVAYVDVAAGAWPGGNPVARRQVVSVTRCNNCHQRLTMHGARTRIEYCVMCHTPDKTDWERRPKDATGNVDLSTVISATSYGTYDDIEERSVHLKVMIHRIHTGARTGSAQLELALPFTVYGPVFFDDVRFPGDVANCELCHLDGTYLLEAIPADAEPTVANETSSIQHVATAAHTPDEPRVPPIQAACMGCHDTAAAAAHVAQFTASGVEQCGPCHFSGGTSAVAAVHRIQAPSR